MQTPEHDLVLELTRAALSGSACVYVFYVVDNLLMARSMVSSTRRAAVERSLFALCAGLFCIVELCMSFMYGSPLSAHFTPVLYAVGALTNVLYARSLRARMAGGSLVHWVVVGLGCAAAGLAMAGLGLLVVCDTNPPMTVAPVEYGNAVLFAMTGGNRVHPSPLFSTVLVLGLSSQLLMLGAMWAGRIRRRFTDPVILLGVTLSSVCLVVELGVTLFIPSHMVLLVFAANLPEVMRISIVERRRHSASLLAQAESARADAESARARAELKAGELVMANKALTDSQNHLIQAGKLAGLGLLVSGIAHELNNPLQLITANAESLTLRLDREKDVEVAPHVSKGLKRILKGADRCGRIIRGLLRFARQSENEMTTLDMRDVVTSTLEFTRSQLRRRGAKVRVDLPLEAVFVCGDSTQLSQVLVTLLLNAADAMDGGGEIVVSVVNHEDTVFLSVQDDGCGIGPDVLPHIFDPFFTTKIPGRGTGLGLSISHSIVDGHGGRIDVESAREEGSTFTVSLPLLAS